MARTRASQRRTEVPECGFNLDGKTCRKRGLTSAVIEARTLWRFAPRCAFIPRTNGRDAHLRSAKWQRRDIIDPLFGEVTWDGESESYVPLCQIGWIELAHKNGKSELLAFIALYLRVGDGVEVRRSTAA